MAGRNRARFGREGGRGSLLFGTWLLAMLHACMSVHGRGMVTEAVRTFMAGHDLGGLQDPPVVFTATISDSAIVDVTQVRVGLKLAGNPGGMGFASDMVVTLTKDFGATAVLLNRVGVTTTDGAGFGYDGWDVVFRDDATREGAATADVHLLEWSLGSLTGDIQPDGRLVPESALRPAMLSALNGQVGNGTWRLAIADMSPGGGMRLESWSIELVGNNNRSPGFVGLTDVTIPETAPHARSVTVQDPDVPAQPIVITLVEGPPGAAVVGGIFQWTPRSLRGARASLCGYPPATARLRAREALRST